MSAFSLADWIEIAAALLVATGCIGELCWIFRKTPLAGVEDVVKAFETKKRKWEIGFALMVAVGVTAELILLPVGLLETVKLHETITNLESTNILMALKVEQFRSNNLALEKQIEQTRQNVIEIDPRKKSVQSVTAFATFSFSSTATNFVLKNWNFEGKAKPAFLSFQRARTIGISTLFLTADTFETWRTATAGDVFLEFKWGAETGHIPGEHPQISAETLLNEIDLCTIDLYFLWPQFEISSGLVKLTLNGSLDKQFSIQPHSYDMSDPKNWRLPVALAFPSTNGPK